MISLALCNHLFHVLVFAFIYLFKISAVFCFVFSGGLAQCQAQYIYCIIYVIYVCAFTRIQLTTNNNNNNNNYYYYYYYYNNSKNQQQQSYIHKPNDICTNTGQSIHSLSLVVSIFSTIYSSFFFAITHNSYNKFLPH